LVHLLFNLSGTLIIYPFEPIRRIPLVLARRLADVALRSRVWAIGYVVGLFYLIPLLFAAIGELVG
jgi:sodium-dependent phosphate cotransporter